MPWSSNRTFLVNVRDAEHHTQAVYKPEAGERPLWDFPAGLWRREVATHLLASQLGWPVIPPTVTRDEGPLGIGSLQILVPADYSRALLHRARRPPPSTGPRADLRARPDLEQHRPQGRPRAPGARRPHLGRRPRAELPPGVQAADGAVGLRRRADPGVAHRGRLPSARGRASRRSLASLLDPFERDAALSRARAVVAEGTFPHDPTGRRYPWPLV